MKQVDSKSPTLKELSLYLAGVLSSFIAGRIVQELEEQFVSHLPELQQAFLNEVSVFVKIVSDWVESKMNVKGETSNEEKSK